MKHIQPCLKTGLLLFTLCAWICAAAPLHADNANIEWNSYSAGMKKIANENKKGFIHFYTDWCTYCKMMNRKTFSNDAVAAYLNQKFIPIRVNGDEQKSVTSDYGVNGFPSNWFVGEDQSNIGSRPGFIPADIFLKMLKFIETDSFKQMSFQDYVDNNS